MASLKLTETESELLTEFIESPTWAVLINKIAKPYVEDQVGCVLGLARGGSVAAFQAGKIDGIADFIGKIYLEVHKAVPANIKDLS